MPKLRLPALVALLLLGALLLAVCGGGDDDDDDATPTPTPTATPPATATAAGDAGTSVEVSLSEWAVRVAVGAIDAGEVAFTVANAGTLSHTFVIVRSDAAPRELLVVAGSVAEDEVNIVARIRAVRRRDRGAAHGRPRRGELPADLQYPGSLPVRDDRRLHGQLARTRPTSDGPFGCSCVGRLQAIEVIDDSAWTAREAERYQKDDERGPRGPRAGVS